jgi:hypothetical protein
MRKLKRRGGWKASHGLIHDSSLSWVLMGFLHVLYLANVLSPADMNMAAHNSLTTASSPEVLTQAESQQTCSHSGPQSVTY